MDEATLKELLTRTIRRPHYLVYTPERTCSYFEKQHYRVLMGRSEPLSIFLAPANLADAEDERGRKAQRVSYDLSGCTGEISRMESLPGALVDEFERAAKAFVSGSGRMVEYEISMRRGFRLPDPNLEPDAYLMYGPEDARRLIILWGCELKQDSSLPLLPQDGDGGNSVLERLRSRIMGPASMRAEALRSLDRSKHPFARFVGSGSFSPDGKLRELVCMGRRIPAASLKRMKYLPKVEIDAFTSCARQYLEEAHPDATGLGAHEKNLRRCLRLPDPVSSPNSYFRNGKQLVIACSVKDDYDVCLHPVDDSTLGLPAPQDGVAVPTVAERIAGRATPVKLYTAAVLTGLLVFGGLAALFVAMMDHKAPALVDGKVQTIDRISATAHRDTPNRIRLVFDEEVAAASLSPEGADALKTFYLIDDDGRPMTIERTEHRKNIIDLYLAEDSAMKDGRRYKLEMNNIADASINRNVIAAGTRVEFDYYDTVPPTIVSDPSAEGSDSRKLRIEFSEALDKFSAENPGNYQIDDFQVVKAEYEAETFSVILTCERRNQNLVDRGFADGGMYKLTVQNGISDASVKRNRPEANVTRGFKYVDTVAPRLSLAKADTQTQLSVLFNEKIDSASVSTSAFAISSKDGPVEVQGARLMADGMTVQLATSPLFNKKEYRVEVKGIADLKGNAITADKPGTGRFHFDGVEDRTPPRITAAEFLKDDATRRSIRVQFDENIDKSGIVADNFRVESLSRVIEVADVQPSGLKRDEVLVVLKEAVNPGETVFVRATDIMDQMGNKALILKSGLFIPPGPSIPLPSDLLGTGCTVNGPESITLFFNDRLDPASAKNPANFFYSGAAKVDRVDFDPAQGNRVILHLSAPAAAQGQTVTAHSLSLENDAPQKQAAVVFKL